MINKKRILEQNNNICETVDQFSLEYSIIISKRKVDELLNFILKSAIDLKASDIHFDVNSNSMIIQFRIDAMLRTFAVLNSDFSNQLIRFIKLRCNIL